MLRPTQNMAIPDTTARVAQAAFAKGNILMTLRDTLGPIFEDSRFADLYPGLGQPAESPARLALVTVLQFMEHLTDRAAADAVRGRIDWKYALGLELGDPGFHYSVLSTFRQRLITHDQPQILFEQILSCCQQHGFLQGIAHQRTDSTRVLAAVRLMNRVELVGETLRRALDALAAIAPTWLLTHMRPTWGERYSRPLDISRLRRNERKLQTLAQTIGQDGYDVLCAVYDHQAPRDVHTVPAIETLRRVWAQQYYFEADSIQWREKDRHGLPPAHQMIASPDDQDARYGSKDGRTWTGYKMHLTETCVPGLPRLITQVTTTVATTRDAAVTTAIQDDLVHHDRTPTVHLMDAGYTDVDNLIYSHTHGIDLVGPMRVDSRWQATAASGYDTSQFTIDWEQMVVTCPEGQTSTSWKHGVSAYGHTNIHFTFKKSLCQRCPARSQCTCAKRTGRILTVYPQAKHAALQAARQRQTTEAFRLLHTQRRGVEGTISQAVRQTGARYARYRGYPRTHVQHLATAAAINLRRVANWCLGERPITAQPTPFATLALHA